MCLFQLPIENDDLNTLATNEVQNYNQVYMLKQMWFVDSISHNFECNSTQLITSCKLKNPLCLQLSRMGNLVLQ